MFVKAAFGITLVLALCFAFQWVTFAKEEPENFFLNPSFEEGTVPWRMDKGGGTVADFIVDKKDAIDGKYSALVTIKTVEEWGSQFGQTMDFGGEKGKTYTFAVLAKSMKGAITVDLQIERHADPWDRVAKSNKFTLQEEDGWTELHVTFKVNVAMPEGWFAYISCTQAKSEYRADMYRLYEGKYIPYKQPESVSASVNSLITTWSNVKSKF